MSIKVTIRLDEGILRELDRVAAETGRTRGDVARDALRRHLALLRFERLHENVLPCAEARGLLTNEDTSFRASREVWRGDGFVYGVVRRLAPDDRPLSIQRPISGFPSTVTF